MQKIVWLDLDGCLVDLERSLVDKFNFRFPKERTPENREIIHNLWYEISNNHPNFWVDIPPTPYYKELYAAIHNVTSMVFILSATPEPFTGAHDDRCRIEKTEWVREYLGHMQSQRTLITKSKNKQDVIARFPDFTHILVDDHPGNIDRWRKAGGIGIHHVDINETLKQLKELE